MPKRLILASASPRRRDLLALLGVPFEVITSVVEEDWTGGAPPQEFACHLAFQKAMDVWAACAKNTNPLVLGADTVVIVDHCGKAEALNKPVDAQEARKMLRMLSGAAHMVYTGLALLTTDPVNSGCITHRASVDTQVQFRELTDEMIDAYVATGEPFDKAGGYGIQGYASAFVEAVYGDYFNVVGLPVQAVGRMLEQTGIEWWRGKDALA